MQPELIKQKAFSAMPVTFSGKHFCDTLRRLGYDNTWIKRGMHLTFLSRYCNRHGKAGWIKKEAVEIKLNLPETDAIRNSVRKYEIIQNSKPNPYPVQSDIEKAIYLLKKNGYKVYRQEWIEV